MRYKISSTSIKFEHLKTVQTLNSVLSDYSL